MINKLEQLNTGVHPNALIAKHPELREFFCLYCDAGTAGEALKICPAHVCGYREGSVLLFSDKRHVAELDALFSRLGGHAGICGPFARASSAYGCAEKAYIAAKLGGDDSGTPGGLHSYADIRFWAFVEQADEIITGEGFSINDFCHTSVFDICEYDRLGDTSYRATLMAYLRSGCNLRAAAEVIGVHRNTLAYRIKRLEEQFGIDLNDSSTRFELLFSFTALEAAGIDWEAYRKPEPGDFISGEARGALWDIAEHRAPCGYPDCICRLLMIDVSDLQDDKIADLFCAAESRFPKSAVAYNDSFVYVLAGDDEDLVDSLRSLLDENSRCGAVSQPFACGRLKLHAELLAYILAAAKRLYPENALFQAKDFCSLAFFSFLQHRISLEPYYCDEVMRVMDHDYRKNTALSKSFYIYLSSFMDMIGAAHEASIHRNTLEYQIKKALSIAGVGPPDDRLRFEMLCTYKMLIALGD